MLTALVGNKVVRAGLDLKGKDCVFMCRDPNCPSPEMTLVAGERGIRTPHFRHRSNLGCKCGAGETEWHLRWKSHFERVEVDMGVDPETGEHNRADALTGASIAVEFQHSPIQLKEQCDRERFYTSTGGLIWVVDASNKRSVARLERAVKDGGIVASDQSAFQHCYLSMNPEKTFPECWTDRPVGVIFDYGDERTIGQYSGSLVYLMPRRFEEKAMCRVLRRDEGVDLLLHSPEAFMNSAPGVKKAPQPVPEENLTQSQNAAKKLFFRDTDTPNLFIDQEGCYWVLAVNGHFYPIGHQKPQELPYQKGYSPYKKHIRRRFRM